MTEVLDKHMPIKKMRVRERDEPYMTSEWKEAIRTKRKYAKLHSRYQTEESGELMRKWRNNATRIRRKAIKQYRRERSEDRRTNPRSFFRTFTPFLKEKNNGSSVIMIKEGNSLVQDQRDGSELFADYFTTMAGSVQTQTQSPGVHPCTTKIESKEGANTEFSFRNMSHSEVLTALQHLNPHKAAGHDLIPPIVLRMVASEI